ncbi:MAG TPA: PHP domain-containing protein [Sphaerochaeta sp.]|jgi:PHP family Zn ribbon phosphoesterase|nr:PHP domain-containing protein [Spirochaetota bacterium]HOE84730.1 PHP domain-containing protein [Sphaerochaeta sp.]HOQ94778.1 PHP domain-containing protein [Sphaerochaeta sp.]HPK46382.1 PHP domain-containing protein [Sphaerochaeta sp.]
MQVRVDLHNHSCLSPCADDGMLPSLLALQAMEMGIQILALSDHNAAENLPAFAEACELCSIMPVFGIEVTTIEEVHLLVLFKRIEEAMAFSKEVQATLPKLRGKSSRFGRQIICDVAGNPIGESDVLLSGASSLSFDEVVTDALASGALVIPAHIDRPAYSVLANLGFLPDLPYTAVEMVHPTAQAWTVVTASDAHFLEEVGKRSCLIEMEEIGWEALKKSLCDPCNVKF